MPQSSAFLPWHLCYICSNLHSDSMIFHLLQVTLQLLQKVWSLACILCFSQTHTKKMFGHCFRVLNIKYSHWNEVHLLYTSIIWSIMANTERNALLIIAKLIIIVLAFAYDAAILLLGKRFLKSCARWSAVAMGNLCRTIKFVTINSALKALFLKTSSLSLLYK